MRKAESRLTRDDYAAALHLLARLERDAREIDSLSRACVAALADFMRAAVAVRPGPGMPAAELHTLELPLGAQAGDGPVIVVTRRSPPFSERERERLMLLQPHLAFLYAQAAGHLPAPLHILTRRESEVMRWLSFGKTDTDIAAVLAISPRTVHKHLEHIYVKLGVETRTAAVMRGRALF
jgi:DNA-binding CsgD family transcriptional regulator